MNDKFVYKPTTAFYKIHKLITEGLPKFKDNEQKVFVIQGGAGSGKTISILMLLIDLLNQSKQEITICSAELSKVKDTVLNDFLKIKKDWNLFSDKNYNKSESTYNYKTGHFVEFIGLDKSDVGKGRRRSIVYINEGNKISLQQFTDISQRAGIVIIDYNPDSHFYGFDLINDFNFINLTYLDNEFLSKSEIANIENFRLKGFLNPYLLNYDVPENVKNNFYANKWRVYGLGQVAILDDIVFTGWQKIFFAEFLKVPNRNEIYVCDWGKSDPFAISHLKVYDKTLYVHEINYKSENEIMNEMSNDFKQQFLNSNQNIVTYTFDKLGIPKDAVIVCDNARPNSIIDLRKHGWEYAIATQNKDILTGVTALQGMNICYTETSTNLELELLNYTHFKDRQGIIKDKFIDAYNHILDGIRYGWEYYFRNNIL